MLVSVGERISNALCAMAIHDLGHEAVSLTGSQAGIVTDTVHGKAKIVEIRAPRINDALDAREDRARRRLPGRLGRSHDVTTLGRGGSDMTAVALAAALGATSARSTPTSRASSPPTRASSRNARKLKRRHLRGDARARGERREGAAATLGRVRAQPRRAAACAVDVLAGGGNVDRRRGGSGAREGDHLRRRAHTDCEPLYRVREIDAAKLFDRLADASVNVDTILQVTRRRDRLQRAARGSRGLRGAARGRSASNGRCATTSAR